MSPPIRYPGPGLHPGLLLLVSVLLLNLVVPAFAAEAPAPVPLPLLNPDFEEGRAGAFPPGWGGSRLGPSGGYLIRTIDEDSVAGRQCAEITLVDEAPPDQRFGSILQSFDATPFRGKRVRFRAAVRTRVLGPGQAQLWMRVDRENSLPGFFDNMDDRPITSPRWQWYEIVGEVAADARKINVGMILVGRGTAWIDAASLEVVGDAGAGNEPPRPLTERGTENLVAFTRLLSYLRFFHPSDQAAAARWQDWALAGIPVAEEAESPEELAEGLTRFFRPIAPTVQIFPTDLPEDERPAPVKPPPAARPRSPDRRLAPLRRRAHAF